MLCIMPSCWKLCYDRQFLYLDLTGWLRINVCSHIASLISFRVFLRFVLYILAAWLPHTTSYSAQRCNWLRSTCRQLLHHLIYGFQVELPVQLWHFAGRLFNNVLFGLAELWVFRSHSYAIIIYTLNLMDFTLENRTNIKKLIKQMLTRLLYWIRQKI